MMAVSIPIRRGAFLAILAAVAACTGDGPGAPTPSALTITKAPVASGDGQSWSTGHTLPEELRVLVTRDGSPVGAVGVTWSVDSGQGVMSPPSSITGSDGIAVSRWTLGTLAGPYQMRAELADQSGDVITFNATAYPNFPDMMEIVSGDGQIQPINTELAEPLIVLVGDQFNNPFPGAAVEWLVISGDATLSETSLVTSDGGSASTTVTLGSTPGPIEIKVQFPGASGGPNVVFHLTATP